MNKFWKVILCIAAVALFAFLMLVDYPMRSRSMISVPEKEQPKAVQPAEPDAAGPGDDESKTESEAEPGEDPAVADDLSVPAENQPAEMVQAVFCFDEIKPVIYEQIYPFLSGRDCAGMIILRNGRLPGDYQRIEVTDMLEMTSDGWMLAVGGSDSIDMTQDFAAFEADWRAYLEDYLARIQVRIGLHPTVYCFDPGQYHPECESVLAEYGFTAFWVFADGTGSDAASASVMRGWQIGQDFNAEDLAAQVEPDSTAVLSIQQIVNSEAEATDESQWMTVEQFQKLFDELSETEASHIEILSPEQVLGG